MLSSSAERNVAMHRGETQAATSLRQAAGNGAMMMSINRYAVGDVSGSDVRQSRVGSGRV